LVGFAIPQRRELPEVERLQLDLEVADEAVEFGAAAWRMPVLGP
jgi:hypothetical protein